MIPISYLSVLKQSCLFHNISEREIEKLLSCLMPQLRTYQKDEYILHAGDLLNSAGLVLSGSVHILQEDFWGNRSIIGTARPGEVFGETYACTPSEPLAVSVITAEPVSVLFLSVARLLHTCPSTCSYHSRLIYNLLALLAEKNRMLTKKIEHISRKTTREKLLSYLSAQSIRAGSPEFTIPFNRQQLADYLSVDRSAMSTELSRLQKDGLLSFSRNHFILKTPVFPE